MKKQLVTEIYNFLMLFLVAALGMWFVAATAIALFWLLGLI